MQALIRKEEVAPSVSRLVAQSVRDVLYQEQRAHARGELKTVPRFPSGSYGFGGSLSSGGLSGMPGWIGSYFGFKNTNVDFQSEVGDLTTSSLVMIAARWLGNTLPEAPLQVKESVEKGDAKPLPNHPMIALLKKPNPFYSGSTLWKAFSLSWIIDGNVFFIKVRNQLGKVIQLWYIPHWLIVPRFPQDGSEFISYYEYSVGGAKFYLPPTDVLHFRDGIDPYNTRRGLSPVASVLREIFTDNETANYSALLLKNSGVPPYVIMPKQGVQVDDPTGEQVKGELIRRSSGDERGKPMFLNAGLDIKELGFEPRKMDLRQLRIVPELRVAAAIGIPVEVLGTYKEHSTYNNVKTAYEAAYQSFLIPLHRHIAEELSNQLLPEFDTDPTHYVTHDLSGVRALQDDEKEKWDRLGLAYQRGGIMRIEYRSGMGLGPSDPENDPEGKLDRVFFDPRGGSIVQPGEDVLNAPQATGKPNGGGEVIG